MRPHKTYRLANANEANNLETLKIALAGLSDDCDGEAIQAIVYATGKAANYENLRDWFKCLYQVLLGQSEGPRMGSFFALYGRTKSMQLIDDALAGKLVQLTGKG